MAAAPEDVNTAPDVDTPLEAVNAKVVYIKTSSVQSLGPLWSTKGEVMEIMAYRKEEAGSLSDQYWPLFGPSLGGPVAGS